MKMPVCKNTKSLTHTKPSSCKNSQAECRLNIQPECPPEYEPTFTHPHCLPHMSTQDWAACRRTNSQIRRGRPIPSVIPPFAIRDSSIRAPRASTGRIA